MPPDRALPFDEILVPSAGGARRYRVDEFLLLDLPTRVRLILEGQMQFTLAGQPVDRTHALTALRTWLIQQR
jgi:hypothetical protein